MSCLHYRGTTLFIDEVSLKTLADQFGTPCYLYSQTSLINNLQAFQTAFADIKHQICYAVKANSNINLLSLLAKNNTGFDIVSLGELERVLAAGGDPKKIVFSGVGKTTFEIQRAIEYGIYCFDVESEPELERIQSIAARLNKNVNIALRLNPDVNPHTHAHISTGLKENKFGIDIANALPLCQKIKTMQGVTLIGIACHIGSQITKLEPFISAIQALIDIYEKLKTIDITISHINIGGGLGIVYQQEQPPSIQDYASAIKKVIAHRPIQLILEPGRAIIANAGVLLTRVEFLKHTDHTHFAIVDAGMNDLLRPALYEAWMAILPVEIHHIEKRVYDIAGPVCESADFLGKSRELALQQNDLLAIDCAGAYGFSMCSNYNSRPRPAEVLVNGNDVQLIRRRETIQELFAAEIIT